jgi:hypothetical protein
VNNWDLVDTSAVTVLGGWLFDRPRDLVHELGTGGYAARERSTSVGTR